MGGMKTRIALNTELTPQDGQAPEWVELIPQGPAVVGNDGRRWLFDEQAQRRMVLPPLKLAATSLDPSPYFVHSGGLIVRERRHGRPPHRR